MSSDKKRKLPEGWKWSSLGNNPLVTLIMGQSPPGETYNKNGAGLPFFQGKADFGNIHPEPSVWCSAPNRLAEPNDILISVRAPVGPTNIAKERCCIGRGLTAIRCKEGLSYKYLIWVLRNFEKKISSEGAGSIFDAIGKDEIKAIEFPIPPTPADQLAIASDLERRMAHVEKMRVAALRQKEAIAAMQGAILREVFPNDGDELPEGWRWMKLGGKNGITEIVNGSTPSTDVPEYWDGDILWATPSYFR
jgi:type I restriction enzyme S subunit